MRKKTIGIYYIVNNLNGKYKVRIKRKDVFIHVGTFKTFQEAYDARQEALQKIFQGD
jgi:hypothetical protein